MTNAAGESSTTIWTLKLVSEPPYFETDPTDFRVVVGYDVTYTFPTIIDGSHTPT